jgi:hypothetical protein
MFESELLTSDLADAVPGVGPWRVRRWYFGHSEGVSPRGRSDVTRIAASDRICSTGAVPRIGYYVPKQI